MNCPRCSARVPDGANFCEACGQPLRQTQEAAFYEEQPRGRVRSRGASIQGVQDPYKDQIKQMKLQLKQLKLYLKQITTQMSSTRARYHETAAFVPHGIFGKGYKWFEDMRLLGPQQQKEQLQRQILQLEQELLGLEQAQQEWQRQNSR
jgi:zinc-ribbon domain